MNWDRTRLEAISLRITKGSTPTTLGSAFTSSGVNFIKAEALNGDPELDSSGFAFVDEETHKNLLKRSVLAEDDVLITIAGAKIGACGRVKKKHLPANTNQAVGIVRIDTEKAHPPFVYYFFKQHETYQFIQGLNAQAAQPNINLATLGSIEIPLPTIETQRHIADAISAYDDLIATNQRRIALLEDAARRLYREWFVHLRFPGHEQVEVKDGVPQGWQRGSAHDFISILSGGTPKTGVEHYWGGDIPFFTPKDSPDAYYVLGTEKTLTETGLASCNSQLFAKNTTFITARGTVGKVALAQSRMAMNQSCYALVPKQGYDSFFLFSAIKDAVEHFKQVAVGGVFDAIVIDTFKVIPFVLPKVEVTKAFGNTVQPLFQQVETLLLQNQQLAQARDLLLPKLMSGQLDVCGIRLPEELAA